MRLPIPPPRQVGNEDTTFTRNAFVGFVSRWGAEGDQTGSKKAGRRGCNQTGSEEEGLILISPSVR